MIEDDRQATELAAALGSQYEVIRLLGRGGMGAVYLAREPFLDRHVAVKVLPAELASGDARERFLREARTAARLSHPHIVPLHTFGQAGDLLFYVMGYVEGEPLEARLRREGTIPVEDARRIVDEVSDALHYAHSLGVVHRDVKPDNILLDRKTGRAMLTDFGIAKERARNATLTRTGMIVGTPHYMSPEQAAGDSAVDGRSDIYALGVIAYRMLTGQLPFRGETLKEVVAQHAVRVPVPPSKVNPEIPLELDRMVMQALAKDPGDRWQTAAAIRQSLVADSDDALPTELRVIAGGGPRLALVAFGLVEVGIIANLFGLTDPPIPALAIAGGWLGVQLLGLLSWISAGRRWGMRATLNAYFRQPSWWTSWWPRRFRRPGDVYDRLPSPVRQMRALNVITIGFVAPIFVNAFLYFLRPSYVEAHIGAFQQFGKYAVVGWMAGFMAPLLVVGSRLTRWARKHAIARIDLPRFQNEPTFNVRFWNRPDAARLLEGKPADRSARDVIGELERIAAAAGTSPHADVYREALDAARHIDRAIRRIDDDLVQLFRDANPAERKRIQESLDALGATMADERAEKQQMRALLRQQLQLFENIEGRKEQVRAHRDRMQEQLNALGLHVASLRAEEANAVQAASLSERIHTLCESIDRRVTAIRETEELVTPS
jgi:hypothetical protein